MIRLFKNYYIDRDAARNAELLDVRARDNASPLFGEIVAIEGRPTFADFFRRVNEVSKPDDLNIVANSDIYFDDSLSVIIDMKAADAYALTRWDDTPTGLVLFADDKGVPRPDTQDCWIWRGPVPEAMYAANFHPGLRGCDNRLTAMFAEAGFHVSNPSLDIKAIHLHRTEIRHYARRSPAVPKPYLIIDPSHLGGPVNSRWNQEN